LFDLLNFSLSEFQFDFFRISILVLNSSFTACIMLLFLSAVYLCSLWIQLVVHICSF
jgi:hypothetical protein